MPKQSVPPATDRAACTISLPVPIMDAVLETAKGELPGETYRMVKELKTLSEKLQEKLEGFGKLSKKEFVTTKVPAGAAALTEAEEKVLTGYAESQSELLATFGTLKSSVANLPKALQRFTKGACRAVKVLETAKARGLKEKEKAKVLKEKAKVKALKEKEKAKAKKEKAKAKGGKPKSAKGVGRAQKPSKKTKSQADGFAAEAAAPAPAAAAAGAGADATGLPGGARTKAIWRLAVATDATTGPTSVPDTVAHTETGAVSAAYSAIMTHADVWTTADVMTRKQAESAFKELLAAYRSVDGVSAMPDRMAWTKQAQPVDADYTDLPDPSAVFPKLYA